MSNAQQTALGVALVVAGLVLALGFPEARFLIFTGRPLGVVLVLVGILDVVESRVRRARRRPTAD